MNASQRKHAVHARMHEIATCAESIGLPTVNVSSELEAIADLLSPRWIRNFIFTEAPLHIQHLLSPSMRNSSLLWKFKYTYINPADRPPRTKADIDECLEVDIDYVMVPVFANGSTTLGVGVMNGWVSAGITALENSTKSGFAHYNFRFMYDSEQGVLCNVIDSPLDGLYDVVVYRLMSTCMMRNSCVMLRRDTFQSVALAGETLRPQDILPHMFEVQVGNFPSDCTFCGMSGEPCVCELRLSPPAHATDASSFFQGMPHFSKTWTASVLGNVMRKRDGFDTYRDADDLLPSWCHFSHQPYMNKCAMDEACAWSVWEFTQRLKEGPKALPELSLGESSDPCSQEAISSARKQQGDVADASITGEYEAELGVYEESEIGVPGRRAYLVSTTLRGQQRQTISVSSIARGHLSADRRALPNQAPQIERTPAVGIAVDSPRTSRLNKRRARNRIAARRYAMKQKKYREEVAVKLEAARSHIQSLKRKERKLRQENMALKQACHLDDDGHLENTILK